MANLNIAVQIAANDQASGKIGKISGALRGISGAAGAGFAGLQTVAMGALGVVAGGVGAFVVGVASIGAVALDTSAQFSQATNVIQTQLGLSEQDAQEFGEVIEDVWGNNFGGSVEEVGLAVATVQQQIGDFGDLTHEEIGAATEDAFRLSDAFGIDVAESTNAVGALMENFGLTADEAFDFVTAGMQRGLNSSDDFLESITEYSTQFGNAGADAGQFFSLLESGLGAGMLGTDKAADAFKEFNVRILDGSDTTRDALSLLGLSIDDITEGINNGSLTQADAFQMVIDKLGEQEDAALQYQTGVALLGTQFEDLGVEAVLALDLMGNQLDNVAGATDSLDAQYDNWPSMWEGIKRSALLAIKPIGDALLSVAQLVMPLVQQAFGWFETTLAPVIDNIATGIGTFVGTFVTAIQDGATPIEAFKTALATIVPEETVTQVNNIITGIQTFVGEVRAFVDEHSVALNGAIQGIGIALGVAGIAALIMGIVGAIGALVSPIGLVIVAAGLLGAAWSTNWMDIQGKTQTGIANITAAVDSFKAMWAVFVPWFNTNVTTPWSGNIDQMKTIWSEGKANIIDLVNGFKLTWAALKTWFQTNVVTPWQGNIQNLETIFTTAKGNITAALDGAKLTFETVFNTIGTLFDNFVTGIGNVVSAIDNLMTWIGNLATAVANFDLGALAALLAQSPPPLAVGIKWVGDEMDSFTRGSLRSLQRGVDDVPFLSAGGARPAAPGQTLVGQSADRAAAMITIDMRGSTIYGIDDFERRLEAVAEKILGRRGQRASVMLLTR